MVGGWGRFRVRWGRSGLGIRVGVGGCGGVLPHCPPPAPSPLSRLHRLVAGAAACPHALVWEDKLGQLLWKRSGGTQEVWPTHSPSPVRAP